ncbi:hypothetical protein BC829DRAFT_8332 [Chytridium lagenaria]|nr:hypothetical protein BC829DRAFT_8332 [Chytridium lagenaria]
MVRLGEIAVELDGLEELNIRGESFSRSCLSLKHVFQEGIHPLACGEGPSENGFRLAKKRKDHVFVRFQAPRKHSPVRSSSRQRVFVTLVTGVVQFLYQYRHDSMFKVKEATAWITVVNPIRPFRTPRQPFLSRIWRLSHRTFGEQERRLR